MDLGNDVYRDHPGKECIGKHCAHLRLVPVLGMARFVGPKRETPPSNRFGQLQLAPANGGVAFDYGAQFYFDCLRDSWRGAAGSGAAPSRKGQSQTSGIVRLRCGAFVCRFARPLRYQSGSGRGFGARHDAHRQDRSMEGTCACQYQSASG